MPQVIVRLGLLGARKAILVLVNEWNLAARLLELGNRLLELLSKQRTAENILKALAANPAYFGQKLTKLSEIFGYVCFSVTLTSVVEADLTALYYGCGNGITVC